MDHRGPLAREAEAGAPAGRRIELELPAGSLLEARRFVLSFGKHAQVLAPEELIADVKDHVLSLAGVYGGAAG